MATTDDLLAALRPLSPWPPLPDVAAALGVDADALADLVVEAEAAGLVTAWESDYTGPTVVMTALACSRLGIYLAETKHDRDGNVWYAWHDVGDEPPAPRARCAKAEVLSEWMDRAASPDPGPLDMLILAEPEPAPEPPRRGPGRPPATPAEIFLPEPHVLIGQTTRSDGPEGQGRPCRACRGRKLAPLEYCLLCDRYGLDHLIPKRPAPARPTPKPRKADGLAGGLGKRAKKAG